MSSRFASCIYRLVVSSFVASLLCRYPTLTLADGLAGQQCGPQDNGASCTLSTCCSSAGYCGATSDYCGANCLPLYGNCTLPHVPSCSGHSASTGRRVGYYQSKQSYSRTCERISPAQINSSGLTHLVLAFAFIDSSTFAVTPADPQDVSVYSQFTALKSSSLQTWISIGGGTFSSSIWSSMVSSSDNRAKFIASLQSFMQQYGFQGADLDWEFPNTSGSDAQNLVALTREMKSAFGSDYGISVTLPADWGSLRGFDPHGMGQYISFLNFMAYDIHGWEVDADVQKTKIHYPADIREIEPDLLPIWANQTDPTQVNLGIPYYGRGYTLSSSNCSTVSCDCCTATGPSNPGPCTGDLQGVMSLYEIEQAVSSNNATVVLDQAAMQKYATWSGNQWIAYDDAETVALKLGWADTKCLGGAVFWSVDFNSGAGSS